MSATTSSSDFDALWARRLAHPVPPESVPSAPLAADLSLGTVLDRHVAILDPAIRSGPVDPAAGAAAKARIADLKTALGHIDDGGLMAPRITQRLAQLAANPPAVVAPGPQVPSGGMS